MNVKVHVGARVPRRGHAFSRWLGRTVLALMGWRIEGDIPDEPKMVLIGAPHTSNMDGVLALSTLTALGLRSGTMIKDSAFKGLLGVLLRWMGAIPINRRSPKGVVEQSVDAFHNNQALLLLLAPEGTRHAAPEWKRGYYLIAHKAGVPILPATCDYQRKVVRFGPPTRPTGDYEADFRQILGFYAKHCAARHPQRMSKPLCDLRGLPWTPEKDTD